MIGLYDHGIIFVKKRVSKFGFEYGNLTGLREHSDRKFCKSIPDSCDIESKLGLTISMCSFDEFAATIY